MARTKQTARKTSMSKLKRATKADYVKLNQNSVNTDKGKRFAAITSYELKNKLLTSFVEQDQKCVLYSEDGTIEVFLSVKSAKMFSPVLKARLESLLTSSGNQQSKDLTEPILQNAVVKTQRVKVEGFSKQTVERFVAFLHGKVPQICTNWNEVIDLLKISHFYNVEKLFNICIEYGKPLIKCEHFIETIRLMDTYQIDQWVDSCAKVLDSWDMENINREQWADLTKNHHETITKVLHCHFSNTGRKNRQFHDDCNCLSMDEFNSDDYYSDASDTEYILT